MGEFTFRWLSVPYIVQVFSLLVLAAFAALTRGDRLIRASLLFLVATVLPYSLALALVGSVNDPVLGRKILVFGVGTVSLAGVSLMMLMLAISGKFEAHRRLFAVAVLLATATAIITWTTDLVVGEMFKTPWGLWYNKGGPLNDVLSSQFVIWTGIGILITRRNTRPLSERQRSQVRMLGLGLTVTLFAFSDSLLVRGIGVYPFSFVPACIGLWTSIVACARYDLLRSRGFDWASFFEIVVVLVLGVAVAAVLLFTRNSARLSSPAMTALLFSPALLVAYMAAMIVRGMMIERWRVDDSRTDQALDIFIERASDVRDEAALAELIESLLANDIGLRSVRLYLRGESGLWLATGRDDAVPVKLDARVRAWLMSNQKPLIADELLTQRLGGLRKPIETFMGIIKAAVVVPMVDRDQLVGLIASEARTDERTLQDVDKSELMQAASAGARALTYIRLFREAAEKMEVVKEVEVATAVQQARAPGGQTLRYGSNELTSYYQPSPQFGGHWWMSHELDDGRILIVIGDVTGHGVSAALISFTVEGACETAQRMFGANLELLSLLQLLNNSVLEVGKGRYAMSCFVALVDPENATVTFANAGHPFPYVCRHSANPRRGKADLRALVSRGTPLGTAEPVLAVSSMELEPSDVLVFFSDSITDSVNPEGIAYGDRRFQRVLRDKVRAAGERACDVIMDDARSFYGNHPITEDINLVVLRLGVG